MFGFSLFTAPTEQPVEEPSRSQSETSSQDLGPPVVLSQCSATTGSSGLSPSVQKESAHHLLEQIGGSPLVSTDTKSKGAKVNVAKRKVEEATNKVQKKVCRALGLSEQDVKSVEARKAKDLDLLMDGIKTKLPTATKTQTYQLLSLIPKSMAIREAAQFFNVGRSVIERVRRLTDEKGILPIPTFSRASSVLESTRLLVLNYYCDDKNSKSMPV